MAERIIQSTMRDIEIMWHFLNQHDYLVYIHLLYGRCWLALLREMRNHEIGYIIVLMNFSEAVYVFGYAETASPRTIFPLNKRKTENFLGRLAVSIPL